ncbi:ATP-dependent DNA helicase DinG [Hydrogenophaga sp. 5NK40-0174]|uniref:ATP-dependent DNA helicase DinG n=1 Tax=Hydrogenophaga sp. 5NK40-0174 TaxID=3127649 RepID=UPI0031076A3A
MNAEHPQADGLQTDESGADGSGSAASGAIAREALALGSFEHVVKRLPGFRLRQGQHEMAEHIARTLSSVAWAEAEGGDGGAAAGVSTEDTSRAIAVVQAGTGVGKSAAYAATVIPLALAQQKRVMISTATVALQEQLMSKDLPALASVLPQPFAYALAKGRGRYVCRLKLDQLAGGDEQGATDLFGLDESESGQGGAANATSAETWHERASQYNEWATMLDDGRWDGDRDRLDDPPEAGLWSAVAAERHTCTAKHCPSYNSCSYYRARQRLAQAQVIVVNHDLLLSTLGLHALPAPKDCYLVLDEAHHLGQVAQGQFTESVDLMHSAWLDKLPRAVEEVAGAMMVSTGVEVPALSRELKAALGDWARLGMGRVTSQSGWADTVARGRARALSDDGGGVTPTLTDRLEGGHLPEGGEWETVLESVQSRSSALLKVFESLAAELRTTAREDPSQGPRCAQLYSRLGALAPRLQHVQATSQLWLLPPPGPQDKAQMPLAKWFEAGVRNGMVTLTAHACPLQPGSLLRNHLWPQVKAAVATSASLMTCGNFDHFLHETGLAYDDAVSTREVQSPFRHAEQGRLVVVQTQADPRDVESYTSEMLAMLMDDLREVERGALVLFTSKAQMRRATDLLERGEFRDLRDRVMVQGEASRTQLLTRHGNAIARGDASILFGMQSFGEGLDLPGALCEWVFITKLPFASPSDPVGQARSDWLKAQGRDAFSELVVPATGARLLQWTGRALRAEDDEAVVVCYDPRLLRQSYGRRMLKGLPPYRLQSRTNGVLSDA